MFVIMLGDVLRSLNLEPFESADADVLCIEQASWSLV